MSDVWWDSDEWERIQKGLPIACVDVLPVRFSSGGEKRLEMVGLILRDTPHQGRRWCFVGGRILYGESLGDAITRQVVSTLGDSVGFHVDPNQQPLYVGQYLPYASANFGFDPRKHALGLTYGLEITGTIVPCGEAISFEWFHPEELPLPNEWGFFQDRIASACINQLQSLQMLS